MRCLLVVALVSEVAWAGPPAWCKDARAEARLADLSSKDVREVLRAFVGAACSPTPEVEAHRAEIDQARTAWSKRLGLAEADWTDVAAWVASSYGSDDTAVRSEATTKDPKVAGALLVDVQMSASDFAGGDWDLQLGFKMRFSDGERWIGHRFVVRGTDTDLELLPLVMVPDTPVSSR